MSHYYKGKEKNIWRFVIDAENISFKTLLSVFIGNFKLTEQLIFIPKDYHTEKKKKLNKWDKILSNLTY